MSPYGPDNRGRHTQIRKLTNVLLRKGTVTKANFNLNMECVVSKISSVIESMTGKVYGCFVVWCSNRNWAPEGAQVCQCCCWPWSIPILQLTPCQRPPVAQGHTVVREGGEGHHTQWVPKWFHHQLHAPLILHNEHLFGHYLLLNCILTLYGCDTFAVKYKTFIKRRTETNAMKGYCFDYYSFDSHTEKEQMLVCWDVIIIPHITCCLWILVFCTVRSLLMCLINFAVLNQCIDLCTDTKSKILNSIRCIFCNGKQEPKHRCS